MKTKKLNFVLLPAFLMFMISCNHDKEQLQNPRSLQVFEMKGLAKVRKFTPEQLKQAELKRIRSIFTGYYIDDNGEKFKILKSKFLYYPSGINFITFDIDMKDKPAWAKYSENFKDYYDDDKGLSGFNSGHFTASYLYSRRNYTMVNTILIYKHFRDKPSIVLQRER